MRVNLKQSEIETAVKQYLAGRGISVAGREVSMDFTSGRKNSGLSVEVDIGEEATPVYDYNNRNKADDGKHLTEVGIQEAVESGPVEESVDEAETATAGVSLFGS